MNYFYHIDRGGRLLPGQIISNYSTPKLPIFKNFDYEMSNHGLFYFAYNKLCKIENGKTIYQESLTSYLCEFALEFIRSTYFPQRKSRFQCFFAVDKPEAFKGWPVLLSGSFNLVTIETNHFNCYDAAWLDNIASTDFVKSGLPTDSFASYCDNAYRYWSGEYTQSPKLEILVQPPFRIMDSKPYTNETFVAEYFPTPD